MLLRSTSDPDIFNSMAGGPPSRSPSPHEPPSHTNDALDDVWGDSAPSSPSLLPSFQTPSSHPSDIPRLQQEHATAGYRDGITAAKAASAQAGFDEGFGLGAVIGARAGRVLGVIEGLAGAVPADEGLKGLLEEARRELGVVSIFGPEYWDREGVWRYEVAAGDGEGKGEEEIVFADVAGAHPLVRKWEGVLAEEARRWGVDLEVLSGEEGVLV
ncbi:hypothetical protein CONLIGDRAFT_647749 [Coniochaeta ligniaria NRRL 30616]|uniref:Protein YAE1 n=1 Tax=Coniochaeta ligniaria NRRL 30616 TaxID=1408157 RepID=A0A1J7IEZ3_9PEZI|nr:hypothetical protein CONLIGDRAFT_647749 [Coniochaeta ligniaria NRRL 30616]